MEKHILWLQKVGIKDVGLVGGKNASLGEMIQRLAPQGVRIPGGFAVTAEAYRHFLKETKLDTFIAQTLSGLNTKNLKELAKRGQIVRSAIKRTEFPIDLTDEITKGYRQMEKQYGKNIDVAVRSSATAEDLPGASFAGEHETYLGIRGTEGVLEAVRDAMASLFTDRAISYRTDKGFAHTKVALSVGVQLMVRSDKGASGVMFTVDTETGFKNAVIINAAWGLGEMVVQGRVTPDEFVIFKPNLENRKLLPIIGKRLGEKKEKMIYAGLGERAATKVIKTNRREQTTFALSDREVLQLARWGALIEKHYTRHAKRWTPMDLEWAKDGRTGQLYIVQARPETVQAERDFSKIKEYIRKGSASAIVRGLSVGSSIATGKARIINSPKHIGEFRKGEILVTTITDPDWEPIMKMASAIVTDQGGRTSHAAIVSRELGIPAVVGCGDATKKLKTGESLTVDTTGSDGEVLRGILPFTVRTHDVGKLPKPKTKIMVNIGAPDIAFEQSFLPTQGVGLAREEFIIASQIGIHPLALLNLKKQTAKVQKQIQDKMYGWNRPADFYVDNLATGIGRIAAAFYPHPVIVRFSDFKTNEYRTLIGGEAYEPKEENPMLGWRGASRYYDPKFKAAFLLECKAIRKVRETMGLNNVIPMVPFCRTPEEGEKVLATMAEAGLYTRWTRKQAKRGAPIVPVYVMCEIPSNVILADVFLDRFDGMSIGSNDLTQLTLGLDRDSGIVSHVANENDPAVRELIRYVIKRCISRRKYIGICGQAPSDYPEFAAFLVKAGITSMSLNPDTVINTTIAVAKAEGR